MDERREIFRVYIELCKHGSQPISDQNSQMLYYNVCFYMIKTLFGNFFYICNKQAHTLNHACFVYT